MHSKPDSAAAPAIIPSALPRFLEGPRRTAVLLLHGWTGYPGQSYYLGERLNAAGYTVSIPRLPGHGTNGKDLLAHGSADWIQKAEEAYLELRQLYAHGDLLNRLEVACIVAAEAIRSEDSGTVNHANRLLWAKAVFSGSRRAAGQMMMALLAANKELTSAQIVAVTDEALQTAVGGAINIFADGS